MTTRLDEEMQFDELLHGFKKVLELKSFAELGHRPEVTRTRVAACFADIRGFTSLVEKAQNKGRRIATDLLGDFFSIFPQAVLREAWDLDRGRPGGDAFQKSVREHIFPSFWKRLGDGMLILWDFNAVADEQLKSGVKLAILEILGFVQEYFYKLVEERNDKLAPFDKLNVDLGIGLASGEAWKLDYGIAGQIDYVGSPLNLAARLQDHARPKGICIHAEFAPTYLIERRGAGEGQIKPLKVRGVEDKLIPVWSSDNPTLWVRRPRRPCKDDFAQLGAEPMMPPYEKRETARTNNQTRRGITEADIESLLETRRRCEAHFASEAARLMNGPAGSELTRIVDRTRSIIKTATRDEFREIGKRFHEEIARLGGPKGKAKERVGLVQSLHEWTTKIYPETAEDREKITAEHEAIVKAVLAGLPDEAADKMREHLKQHNERVINEALLQTT